MPQRLFYLIIVSLALQAACSLSSAQSLSRCTTLFSAPTRGQSKLHNLNFSKNFEIAPMGSNFLSTDTISKMTDRNGNLVLFRTIRGKHRVLSELSKSKQSELLARDLSYSLDPFLPQTWANAAFGRGKLGGPISSEGDWVIIGVYALAEKKLLNPFGSEGSRSILRHDDSLDQTMAFMGEVRVRVENEIVLAEVPLETYLEVLNRYDGSVPIGPFVEQLLVEPGTIIR